jgi:outer membrane protein OmpA-like peptidoglycan-associated protein
MRASSTFPFGAAAVLAACVLASLAPARADPAYSSENVVQIFLKQKGALTGGKTRALCVGTAADCKKQEAAEAPPPPVQFDLLANFEFNSDQLTQAARENLDQFAKAIKDPRLAGSKFEIDGHTDAVGPEEYNQGLSERRADAVVSYLASDGIDKSLLLAKGFGKSKPRVANPYSPENRRVETHLSE